MSFGKWGAGRVWKFESTFRLSRRRSLLRCFWSWQLQNAAQAVEAAAADLGQLAVASARLSGPYLMTAVTSQPVAAAKQIYGADDFGADAGV